MQLIKHLIRSPSCLSVQLPLPALVLLLPCSQEILFPFSFFLFIFLLLSPLPCLFPLASCLLPFPSISFPFFFPISPQEAAHSWRWH